MSESKRKEAIRKATDAVVRKFTDDGRLIEIGFGAMMLVLHPEGGLPDERIIELRDAFMSGAQHLFGSIIGSLLDENAEPTEADMDRMTKIDAELDAFVRDFARRHRLPPPALRKHQ